MIRRVLLEEEKLLIPDGNGKWSCAPGTEQAFLDLVGDTTSYTDDLGIIQSLSPVFLASSLDGKIQDFHFQTPKDSGYYGQQGDESIEVLSNQTWTSQFVLDGYSPKNGIHDRLTSKEFWKGYKTDSNTISTLNFSDFFEQIEHVGIRRTEGRRVEEDSSGSLYRRFAWKLKKDKLGRTCEFAFKLELSEEKFPEGFSRLVYLGADRSTFKMQCEQWKDDLHSPLFPQSTDGSFSKAACLSEFDPSQKPNHSTFILSEKKRPFEMILFQKNTNRGGNARWINKMNLFPKGTVFFFDEQTERPLTDYSFLTKIGYNYLLYI